MHRMLSSWQQKRRERTYRVFMDKFIYQSKIVMLMVLMEDNS